MGLLQRVKHALPLLLCCLVGPACRAQPPGTTWPARPIIERAAVLFSSSLSSDRSEASLANYTNAARAFKMKGDIARAVQILKSAVAIFGGDGVTADHHFDLGEMLARQGERDEARAHLRMGLGAKPLQPKHAEMLALLEEEAGEVLLAQRLYVLAARLTSRSNQARLPPPVLSGAQVNRNRRR